MSVCLDASLLVALFTNDPSTKRAEAALRKIWPILIVSDFAAAEFASAVARRVRMAELTTEDARRAFSAFDEWIRRTAKQVVLEATDLTTAIGFLRRLDLNLRAPDAINLAMSQRAGAQIATFDDRMRINASALRLDVADV